MEIYAKTPEQEKNADQFRDFVRRYEWAGFYRPNPEKAPWHWQCIVRGEGPYNVLINFWPHKAKAQREGFTSVQGWDEIRSVMTFAIEENGFEDGIEVLE